MNARCFGGAKPSREPVCHKVGPALPFVFCLLVSLITGPLSAGEEYPPFVIDGPQLPGVQMVPTVPPTSDPLFNAYAHPTPTSPAPFVTRFSGGYDFGKNVGIETNFTTIEWFMPLSNNLVDEMFFGDARGIIRDDATTGANLGLGYRRFSHDRNRIWGINAYYDFREAEFDQFHQLGLGFESLGPLFDFRGNFYIPNVGEVTRIRANDFVGNWLLGTELTALTGGDLEVGVSLPYWNGLQSRLFAGGYYFDGPNTKEAAGWRFRSQHVYRDLISVDLSVQEDDAFGRTAMLGISLRYQTRLLPPHRQALKPMDYMFFRPEHAETVQHRLGDPVERLQNIVLAKRRFVATDPMGNPLNFLHVVPGNPGVGTFEDPYPTLSAALADAAAPNSIIYTPEGGDFVENVTLVDGATVLSNGPAQIVETQLGPLQLPFSGAANDLNDLPTITGNVAMANDSQFSGFDVTGQLTAISVNNPVVDNTVVNFAGGDAVIIVDVDGGVFNTMEIGSTGGSGILLIDSSADLTDITVTEAVSDGVEISNLVNDREITISNLTVAAAAIQALDVNLLAGGNLTLTLDGDSNLTSVGTALHAQTGGASTGDLILAINETTTASTTGAGMEFDGSGGAGTLFITEFANNRIAAAATGGLLVDTVTFDADPLTAGIQQVNGQSLIVGDASVVYTVQGDGVSLLDPTGSLAFSPLRISNEGGTGLLVDTKGGGTIFDLTTSADSTIDTSMGAAMSLDPLTVDLSFSSVESSSSPTSAIFLDTIDGVINIVTANLNEAVSTPIVIQNTPAPLNLNITTANILSLQGPTLNDNLDTSLGNGGNVTVTIETLNITEP